VAGLLDLHGEAAVKFLAITLIVHSPDPRTGLLKPVTERFREVIDNAVLAEELGFEGFGVGERHERPFLSSSPPVVLSHIAARTSRIRLFTAVTTLSPLDPVRAYEEYATLDHLSCGRLELMIGKGNGAAQAELFHVTAQDQWERNREGYELFRRLWREDKVTWSGRYRPSLTNAERRCRARSSSRSASGTAAPPARSRWTWPPGTATRCSPPTSPVPSTRTPN
jgi:alkanesulfonate monooxygenase SsuD/methylene tetrahydromethanopterin reductase-like flavin-dependent oxidoreductase (luciferase family)